MKTFAHIKRSSLLLATLALAFNSLFVAVPTAKAAGEAITGATNKTGLADEYISLGSLQITAPGNPNVPVNISVPFGELSFTGDTSSLTFASEESGENIAFSGDLSDVNAALATLRFRTTRAGVTQVDISISSPGEVYYPGNGHVYEIVEAGSSITWAEADTLAKGRTKYGATGYLATITSQQENDYISPRLDGSGWFGASDVGEEGDWKWVTGPETGTSFWSGLSSDNGGGPVASRFSNWASGEPNDAGDEDCAQFYSDGSGWNDLPCTGASLDYYVVEYGDDDFSPEVVSTSFNVTTSFPSGATIEISDCNELIAASTASEIENRYDSITFTDDIDCEGETITPLYNDEDDYFGYMGFRGTINGQGHTISNFVIDETTQSTGLFASADAATISNLTIRDASVTGDGCVGGLVGRAYGTTITNVDVDVTLIGNDSIGGIVGCIYAEQGDGSLSNSTVSGSVSGEEDGEIGGIIGFARAENGYNLTIHDNESTTEVNHHAEWSNSLGGLIGYTRTSDGGSINVQDNSARGVTVTDASDVGGLVGYARADDAESSIQFEANQVTSETSAESQVGGLIGYVEASEGGAITIADTHLTQAVSGEWGQVGGLIGELYLEGSTSETKAHITDSSVNATITGNSDTGGLVGGAYFDYGEEEFLIEDSFASGAVTSFDNGEGLGSDIGGLVGQADGVEITRSYASNTVNGYGDVGGLVGDSYDTDIQQSYATGSVTAEGWSVGGLVGNLEEGSIIDSYARGDVSGEGSVGGLVGYSYGEIVNSYATGLVTGEEDLGGLVGYNDMSEEDIDSSFWDTQTSGQATSQGGTGKTTVQMKKQATFTNTATTGLNEAWNFADVWGMVLSVNDGYPCLTWQHNSCVSEAGTDGDEDGISDSVEAAAPNGGDANNDGIPDNQQSNVTSFVNTVNKQYVSVAVDDECTLTQAVSTAESSQNTQDAGYNYQAGLLGFTADCGDPGYTTSVSLYHYGVSSKGLVLRKYNPQNSAYFTIIDAVLAQQTIGGKMVTVATYTITDGGELDTDGTANGIIVDPVGLASLAVGAPNTGLRRQ